MRASTVASSHQNFKFRPKSSAHQHKRKNVQNLKRELDGKQKFLDELKHIIAHFLFECSCTINPSAHSSQIPQPIVIIESPSVQTNKTCNRMIYDLLSSYSSSLFCVFFPPFLRFVIFKLIDLSTREISRRRKIGTSRKICREFRGWNAFKDHQLYADGCAKRWNFHLQ